VPSVQVVLGIFLVAAPVYLYVNYGVKKRKLLSLARRRSLDQFKDRQTDYSDRQTTTASVSSHALESSRKTSLTKNFLSLSHVSTGSMRSVLREKVRGTMHGNTVYGVIAAPYRKDLPFWYVILHVLFRRFIYVLAAELLVVYGDRVNEENGDRASVRNSVLVLLLFLYFASNIEVRPYAEPRFQAFDLFAITNALLLGMFYVSGGGAFPIVMFSLMVAIFLLLNFQSLARRLLNERLPSPRPNCADAEEEEEGGLELAGRGGGAGENSQKVVVVEEEGKAEDGEWGEGEGEGAGSFTVPGMTVSDDISIASIHTSTNDSAPLRASWRTLSLPESAAAVALFPANLTSWKKYREHRSDDSERPATHAV
jgi:hypothetical protein